MLNTTAEDVLASDSWAKTPYFCHVAQMFVLWTVSPAHYWLLSRGCMIRKRLLIISSRFQTALEGARDLVSVWMLMQSWMGWFCLENQELHFSKVKLEAVDLNMFESQWDLLWNSLGKQSEDNFMVQSKPKTKPLQPFWFPGCLSLWKKTAHLQGFYTPARCC